MILTGFTCNGFAWNVKKIDFGFQNLLVGRNAEGKSHVLRDLTRVSRFIAGGSFPTPISDCELFFEDGDIEIVYSFTVSRESIVLKEKLVVEESTKILREETSASFYGDLVNPPSNRLLVQIRRDTEKYPEVELVMQWVENFSLFVFSTITPQQNLKIELYSGERVSLADMFDSFAKEEKKTIIAELNKLGFGIKNINSFKATNLQTSEGVEKYLYIQEQGGIPSVAIRVSSISTGLFRVITILFFLHFISSRPLRCLLIDDLGEGLDYFRSANLGRFVFNYCKDHNIQLIVSSNDSFLMDVVDINDVILLRRESHTVSAITSKTYPDLFRKFGMTGLSNFDFYSSDFVARTVGKMVSDE